MFHNRSWTFSPPGRKSPLFDECDRAALRWAESLTPIESTGAVDDDYEVLAAAFDERERVELSLVINVNNAWNRFAIGFRSVHPCQQAAYEH